MFKESASLSLALVGDSGGESSDSVRLTRAKKTRERIVTSEISAMDTDPLLK